MSTYGLYFTSVASVFIEVEADDLDGAIDLAYAELPGSLCAQCAGWNNPPGIDLSGDWEFDEKYHQLDGASVESKS